MHSAAIARIIRMTVCKQGLTLRELILEPLRLASSRYLNPRVVNKLGRPGQAYSVLYHVGRRSGRVYRTPVQAWATSEGFVIPVTYGRRADWCRNVLAAGRCQLLFNGIEYKLADPTIVDYHTAAPALPFFVRLACRLIGIKQFLVLRPELLARS